MLKYSSDKKVKIKTLKLHNIGPPIQLNKKTHF